MMTDTAGRKRLVALMRRKGWGPVEVAAKLGADHAQISRIAAGRQRPGLDLAIRIDDAMGIGVRWWVQP